MWSFDETGESRPGHLDDLIISEAIAAAVAWTPEANDDGWLLEGPERHATEYRLGRRFAHSPEASDLSDGSWYWQTFAHWAVSQIGSTVASLDASRLEELEALMGDSANFDPAKSMVMQALARGIDPSTPEGAMQMHAEYNAQLAKMQLPFAGFDPSYDTRSAVPSLDPAAKRRAAHKAREKNC